MKFKKKIDPSQEGWLFGNNNAPKEPNIEPVTTWAFSMLKRLGFTKGLIYVECPVAWGAAIPFYTSEDGEKYTFVRSAVYDKAYFTVLRYVQEIRLYHLGRRWNIMWIWIDTAARTVDVNIDYDPKVEGSKSTASHATPEGADPGIVMQRSFNDVMKMSPNVFKLGVMKVQ